MWCNCHPTQINKTNVPVVDCRSLSISVQVYRKEHKPTLEISSYALNTWTQKDKNRKQLHIVKHGGLTQVSSVTVNQNVKRKLSLLSFDI